MPPATPARPTSSTTRRRVRRSRRSRSRHEQAAQVLVGLGAVLFTILLVVAGWFGAIERATFDWRTRWFDVFSPPPSDAIVIAGIDDRAIREVQAWPWDRVYLASAIRELSRAGANVIALDVLIEEPQPPRVLPGDDPFRPLLPLRSGDDELSRAIAEHVRVVAPVRFRRTPWEETPSTQRAADERRIDDAQRARTLHAQVSAVNIDTWSTIGNILYANTAVFPTWCVASRASRLGDVSLHAADPDGVVRSVAPAVLNGDAAILVWPNFAVAAAFLHTGSSFVVQRDGVIGASPPSLADPLTTPWLPLAWPRGGRSFEGQFTTDQDTPREISLAVVLEPVLIQRGVRANLLAVHSLLKQAPVLGLSVPDDAASLALSLASHPITTDNDTYESSINRLAALCEPVAIEAKEFLEFLSESETAPIAATNGATETASNGNDDDPEAAARVALFRSAAHTLPALLRSCQSAANEVEKSRVQLRRVVDGRLVFIGWTSTGALADMVHTSLHPRTPGVYVHAAVANSVLAGFIRRPAPMVLDLATMLILGVLGTLIAATSRFWLSPILVLALLGGWFIFCGLGLWDYARLITSCSGPMLSAGAGWLAATMHRALFEQRGRRQTEAQFRAYVSPEVVDVLVENPGLRSLAPQRSDLAVLMADLEGFTALAERLGEERTARVLARYLGEMTDVLLAHGATIDKYLGDGIMAFWGAPIHIDPTTQAHSACAAALLMQRRLAEIQDSSDLRDAGPFRLRIGIACGPLMVGDFGCPPRRSSYTVIGDAANLASRLEEACKSTDAGVLISNLVRERAAGAVVVRSAGTLHLRGREQPEPAWALIQMSGESSFTPE